MNKSLKPRVSIIVKSLFSVEEKLPNHTLNCNYRRVVTIFFIFYFIYHPENLKTTNAKFKK